MHMTPPLPPLKRVPPGVWTVFAWWGGLVFTFLVRIRLPGESGPAKLAGSYFYRWDGLACLAVATALAHVAGVLLRRRPLPALGLLLAAAVLACVPLGVAEIPLAQFLAVDVALYFIAADRARRTGIIALLGALSVLIGYLTTRLLFGWPAGTSAELAVAMTAVIAWLVGHSVRQAREHAETLVATATAQAVADERLRISRELHDTVAHSIGVIALQAGAARRVIDTQPRRAGQALGDIETVGRETLSGLRRMLGVMRHSEQSRPLDPAPGLSDLDLLVATTTDAGVHVEVRRLGERCPLPPEIDLSAYRIIQEAITNVVRHAGTNRCRVSIEYRDDELAVEVLDGGRGLHRTAEGGYGLVGMRERVSMLQGSFSAEPCSEGGFRVTARLPLTTGAQ
ncbi:sensor histidine kinase [Streptosporangium sp. NBC_01756]|uniref:sensor histidine kinase n=1 Tax=Streptosporangium sp. NBC_01756 TaxID=2975950 RepID=UPI002DD83FEC|nr:sensor histidine kinase [Streptosporangium sp. NBC_01756]WSC86597.1 sensor histidine kinase [Streptosporangium sp. NBC_01756]